MAFISDSARADSLLLARLDDALALSARYDYPRFVGFLDEREVTVAAAYLRKRGDTIGFYGGHPQAERQFVGVFPLHYPVEEPLFPIRRVAFTYRGGVSLSHRDVLGALLATGIRREKIGDILCGEGLSVAMVEEELVPFLVDQIDCIGREGVTVIPDYTGELPTFRRFSSLEGTVASPRLDAVVKWLISSARESAAQTIRAGIVSLNHCVCTVPSQSVNEQDVLSVRGKGRFLIAQIGPITAKGRLHIKAMQYI